MGKSWHRFRQWLSGSPGRKVPEGFREADHLLGELANTFRVPGLAVEISSGEETLFSAGYGRADLERGTGVLPDSTVFRGASISKPITATALALLLEEGLLDLDEDVRVRVPEFPEKHGRVTLRQLASHTAGIRGYRGKEFALNIPYSISGALDIFKEDPLLFPPGKGYHYNSFDFVLLSLAMERAAGLPFHRLVEDRVLRPLAMTSTCMETPGKPVPGQASFYSKSAGGFKEAVPVDTRYKLAGGGYLTTVSDVCRLGRAYLQEVVASPDILEPFLTSGEVAGKPTFYGLGWQVSTDAASRSFYGHVGNAVGAYSNFFVYPQAGLVFAFLVNCSVPGIQPVLDRVVDAVHRNLPAPV